jgi:uncharacterized protein YunC (DUF1805 family)
VKVVIELDDGTDNETYQMEVLKALVRHTEERRRITNGCLNLGCWDTDTNVGCRVVGIVTAEDSPGDQLVMAVEELTL